MSKNGDDEVEGQAGEGGFLMSKELVDGMDEYTDGVLDESERCAKIAEEVR